MRITHTLRFNQEQDFRNIYIQIRIHRNVSIDFRKLPDDPNSWSNVSSNNQRLSQRQYTILEAIMTFYSSALLGQKKIARESFSLFYKHSP